MTASARLGRRAPEQRRTAVLDAAQALFLADGVGATSIDAIAARAGVAKGTVYLYFGSKEAILRELETQFEARIVGRVRGAADRAEAGTAAVQAWCVELVDAYLDDLDAHDMLFHGRAPITRESTADDPLVDDLTALLTAEGGMPAADTAAFLVGGITLLVDRAVVTHRSADRAELARATRQIVQAVAAAPPSP